MSSDSYTLLFVTAQWCDPGTAMLPIFEETLRDFARLYPQVTLEGIVVDLDEEETNHQVHAASSIGNELLESISFVPTLILLHGDAHTGEEIIRLVGQLPKLVIRRQLAEALGLVNSHTTRPRAEENSSSSPSSYLVIWTHF